MYDDKHLYVIELPTGEVKVGMTENPKSRLKMYGHDLLTTKQPFISADKIGPASECEKIVCYRLRKYLHRGKEFFKCDLDHAIEVMQDVLFELESGTLNLRCPETESLFFHTLEVGTTEKLLEAARKAGFETARQLFISWIDDDFKVRK